MYTKLIRAQACNGRTHLPGSYKYANSHIVLIILLKPSSGGEGVSAFPEGSVTKVHGSTLLALRGGGWCQILRKKALRNT